MAASFGWAIGGGRFGPAPAVSSPRTGAADWQSPRASAGTVVIPRGMGGHFFIGGDVAGKPLHFLIDTGATTVAISRSEAEAIGLDTHALDFNDRVETASGTVPVAAVTLPRLRVGDIQLLDVRAVVMDMPSDIALLGQSFLDRIDRVSIEGDRMTLTKL